MKEAKIYIILIEEISLLLTDSSNERAERQKRSEHLSGLVDAKSDRQSRNSRAISYCSRFFRVHRELQMNQMTILIVIRYYKRYVALSIKILL